MDIGRPRKSCESSSRWKFRALQFTQNWVIRDKGWTEVCALDVGIIWSNPQILSVFPQSIALHPQFWILNTPFSIFPPQKSFIQPQLSILNSPFSILSKKYGIFGSKSPQNSVISDKMFASAACSFSQVWIGGVCLLDNKADHLSLSLTWAELGNIGN